MEPSFIWLVFSGVSRVVQFDGFLPLRVAIQQPCRLLRI
jgi:hypothetical protein